MSDPTGTLTKGGWVHSSYRCGECKQTIAKPGGRKRRGNQWICPPCVGKLGLNKV